MEKCGKNRPVYTKRVDSWQPSRGLPLLRGLRRPLLLSDLVLPDDCSFDIRGDDGNIDLLLGGNLYHVKPEVGRYDASYGNFLEGDGKGGFKVVPPAISGFRLEGEIRDIQSIQTPAGTVLLVARSNDPLQLFRIQEQ